MSISFVSEFIAKRTSAPHVMAIEGRSGECFARHTHDDYGIGVMQKGGQRSWSGRGFVESGPGDLITVNPGEVHDGAPIGDSRTWTMLFLTPDAVHSIILDIHEDGPAEMEFTRPVLQSVTVAQRFAAAYTALTTGDCNASAAEERLIFLFAGLHYHAGLRQATPASSLARVKQRIDDDPSAPHPLIELAGLAGIGKFQTIRNFTRMTGLTPHAYIVQRRLDLARSMIRRGTVLADAANAAGFSDQSHFHRTFTKRYGLTPGAYSAAVR